MNIFENATFYLKKIRKGISNLFKGLGRKNLAYLLFLALACLVYIVRSTDRSKTRLHARTLSLAQYQERLSLNTRSVSPDTLIIKTEREQLLLAIEENIVSYLYQIPDYSYMQSLETYFKYRPDLLEQIPSAVPLQKGDYRLSSRYGIRNHPISKKAKKHFGIDLAAAKNKPVYASASGTITDIIYSEKGYGTHILVRHRFGFQTLYGHLEKVLVRKGQSIKQHELLATVGSSGSSTGYHLHYETIKNDVKIDPRPSLNLKKSIYDHLMEQNIIGHGEK